MRGDQAIFVLKNTRESINHLYSFQRERMHQDGVEGHLRIAFTKLNPGIKGLATGIKELEQGFDGLHRRE
jgi:hypothetical protein